MTRIALGRWTGSTARGGAREWLAANMRRAAIDEPWLRIALAHLAVLLAVDVSLWSHRSAQPASGLLLVGLVVTVGLTILRILSVRKRLVPSTLMLDALGTAILLVGTGGVGSPYLLVAVAGAWWAAHVPARHGAVTYGATFAFAYLVLMLPRAMPLGLLGEALEDSAFVLVVALLSAWFTGIAARGRDLDPTPRTILRPEGIAVREGLGRALRTMDVPVDAVLTAGRLGLTAVQTELLTYLVLGLTNAELADAIGLSEAAVRYRLTRLYRALGVRSRREAAEAARDMGLTPLTSGLRKPRTQSAR